MGTAGVGEDYYLYHNENLEMLFFFFPFCHFFGPLPRHMEVPRLGVESELLPPAYARAAATQDPRHIYDLHHSSRQRRIVNPLSKARDRTPQGFINTEPRRELRVGILILSSTLSLSSGDGFSNF